MGAGVWFLVSPVPRVRPSRPPSRVMSTLEGLLEEAGYQHLHLGTVLGVLVLGASAIGFVVSVLIPIPVLGVLSAIDTGRIIDIVESCTTIHYVRACTTKDCIIAVTAADKIITGASIKDVVAV